jgi:hypothetical protein
MQVSTTSLSPGASTSSAWADAMSVPSSLAKCGKSQGLAFSASGVASGTSAPSGQGISISTTQLIFTEATCPFNITPTSCLHSVEEISSTLRLTRFGQGMEIIAVDKARAGDGDMRSTRRSPGQDDFAKRPILDQMAQGFARLAERIDPLDDRLDGPAGDQREDFLPRGGYRGR